MNGVEVTNLVNIAVGGMGLARARVFMGSILLCLLSKFVSFSLPPHYPFWPLNAGGVALCGFEPRSGL